METSQKRNNKVERNNIKISQFYSNIEKLKEENEDLKAMNLVDVLSEKGLDVTLFKLK